MAKKKGGTGKKVGLGVLASFGIFLVLGLASYAFAKWSEAFNGTIDNLLVLATIRDPLLQATIVAIFAVVVLFLVTFGFLALFRKEARAYLQRITKRR